MLWSLSHILERAKRDLPVLRPDTVILYSGFNEGANANFLNLAGTPIKKLVAEERYAVAARNYPASDWLYFNSILFKIVRIYVRYGYKHFFPPVGPAPPDTAAPPAIGPATADAKAPPPTDPAVLKNYLVALERFVKVVRDSGADPIFVIQATREAAISRLSQIGAKTACVLGVRVLDARRAVAAYPGRKDELFRSTIHYSAKGAAVLADYLYDRLYKRKGFSICSEQ